VLRYGSVCSGIEAASLAFEPLGMEPAWFSEIHPFCSAVLSARWPGVTNHGDMTADDFEKRAGAKSSIDILVGGTPCQSFSTSGRRGGLGDPRGQLTLRFLDLAGKLRPTWVVWENVPGVLSHDGGRTFGTVLGGLAQLGYGWAYRVLDAVHFGVAQRRRRVYLVGRAGGLCPRKVLFESQREGHPAEAGGGQGTGTDRVRARGDGGLIGDAVPIDLRQASRGENLVNNRSRGSGGPAGLGLGDPGDPAYTLSERGQAVVYQTSSGPVARRLTPREHERLQGMPDDHTLVPWKGKPAADGPRYKAVGNSMAVPVMRWIGRRILDASGEPT
jgi:DNA (cytosine-5)-methyltransferase 1